jgi:hypothetical protein
MRRGRLGKPHSSEARRKMSEAQRRRGAWPPPPASRGPTTRTSCCGRCRRPRWRGAPGGRSRRSTAGGLGWRCRTGAGATAAVGGAGGGTLLTPAAWNANKLHLKSYTRLHPLAGADGCKQGTVKRKNPRISWGFSLPLVLGNRCSIP